MLVNSKFEWTEHICDINQDFSGETTPQYIIPPRDINFDFDGKIVNCQVNLYRVHDRPTIKINVSKVGGNICPWKSKPFPTSINSSPTKILNWHQHPLFIGKINVKVYDLQLFDQKIAPWNLGFHWFLKDILKVAY